MGTTATTVALFFAAMGLSPTEGAISDHVDLVEVNHCHDEQGKHVYDQIIFYDWSAEHGRYQVRAWRMVKSPRQIPKRDWKGSGYIATWHDSQNGNVLRKVQADALRETWTQHDPELTEREFLPTNKRRDLSRPPSRSSVATNR